MSLHDYISDPRLLFPSSPLSLFVAEIISTTFNPDTVVSVNGHLTSAPPPSRHRTVCKIVGTAAPRHLFPNPALVTVKKAFALTSCFNHVHKKRRSSQSYRKHPTSVPHDPPQTQIIPSHHFVRLLQHVFAYRLAFLFIFVTLRPNFAISYHTHQPFQNTATICFLPHRDSVQNQQATNSSGVKRRIELLSSSYRGFLHNIHFDESTRSRMSVSAVFNFHTQNGAEDFFVLLKTTL